MNSASVLVETQMGDPGGTHHENATTDRLAFRDPPRKLGKIKAGGIVLPYPGLMFLQPATLQGKDPLAHDLRNGPVFKNPEGDGLPLSLPGTETAGGHLEGHKGAQHEQNCRHRCLQPALLHRHLLG